ncbi:MAG: hypothetical protein U0Q16_18775 [Bryobacteraceae bacterium]
MIQPLYLPLFDRDLATAEAKYRALHTNLVEYFEHNDAERAAGLADETIVHVSSRRRGGGDSCESECLGIASLMVRACRTSAGVSG